jgi:cob(I)alamin adenosyltransferase
MGMKKIYTKTGDKGQTALINGERLAKDSLVFTVLGTLDEFNAGLGLLVASWDQALFEKINDKQLENFINQKNFLLDLQKKLFKLGAEIAKSPNVVFPDQFLIKMEKNIDELQGELGDDFWSNFVLPGGSQLAAHTDLARTICRRLERELVALDRERDLRDILVKFINRTSDYLYILRSFINHQLKVKEIPV